MPVHYVQICHDQKKFESDGWVPWKQCTSLEETANLAAHKFIREAGFAGCGGDFKAFELMIYVAEGNSPRHKNGRFMTCHGFKMNVTPNPK